MLLVRNLSNRFPIVWRVLQPKSVVENARRQMVRPRHIAYAHPGMNWFVAMMRPVNGVADGTKRMQPGEHKNKKERSNNQPLIPAKPAQCLNELLHNRIMANYIRVNPSNPRHPWSIPGRQ
jgi:hypothetical protein